MLFEPAGDPGWVDGVVIVTRPDVTEKIVQDAVVADVPRVWVHANTLFGTQNNNVSQHTSAGPSTETSTHIIV